MRGRRVLDAEGIRCGVGGTHQKIFNIHMI